MTGQRVLALVLFVVAFLALAASRAFPFLDDVPGAAKVGIAVAGAACVLVGVWLWRRASPESEGIDG
ncbi:MULTISPECIES: hypothetical protein [unclassified Micromonospora]|uniref:hypothetical protein n=2 Tax=Micromonospora TaxID=1873 RepID=UPI0022C7FE4D|nr:hypothetical protein [Micromonospora sp. AKA38]GHJ13954.1 hypothetical protein TPA0908_19490 [Micromonospora sp. AKA38]